MKPKCQETNKCLHFFLRSCHYQFSLSIIPHPMGLNATPNVINIKKKPNSLQLNRSPRSSSSLAVPCTTGGKLIDNAITGAQQKGQWGKNNQNWKCNETLALADRQGPSYPENCKNWWRKNCPNEIAIWMSPETNQPRTVTRLVPEHFRLPEFQGNDVFECSCKLPTRFHST